MNRDEILTPEQINDELAEIAQQFNLTYEQLRRRFHARDLGGSILASRAQALFFLLGEDRNARV